MRETDENNNVRHFRSTQRYFCENGQWWFSTREGEEGPFPTREAAEAGMQRYVDSINAMKEYRRKHQEKYGGDDDKKVDHSIWNKQIDTL